MPTGGGTGGGIRANPETRLPGRARRDYGITRDVKLAWLLLGRAVAAKPLLFLIVTTSWGIVRFVARQGLRQAHLGLGSANTIADFEFWGRVGLAADFVLLGFGPLILAAVLMPPLHRRILSARPPASWRGHFARAAKLALAALALALTLALAVIACAGLPLFLLRTLGQVSTILLATLLLPLLVITALSLLRWIIGLPGVSLGLPRSLAEGWIISRGHLARSLAIFVAAGLPLSGLEAIWLTVPMDPLGWVATVLKPIQDVLFVALTASLTGLLYRAYRLPAAFRPDLRPSRNHSQRREPVLS